MYSLIIQNTKKNPNIHIKVNYNPFPPVTILLKHMFYNLGFHYIAHIVFFTLDNLTIQF